MCIKNTKVIENQAPLLFSFEATHTMLLSILPLQEDDSTLWVWQLCVADQDVVFEAPLLFSVKCMFSAFFPLILCNLYTVLKAQEEKRETKAIENGII